MLRNPGLRKSVEQPVLDLNFAASQIGSNGAPDSRIDFSRGTNAWFVDSDGLVKKSPHNLLLRSEDFGTTWSATRSDVTANATTSPIGTLTADKLYLDDTNSTSHFAIQNVSIGAGQKHTFSVYLKADDLTHAHVALLNNTSPYEAIRIGVDLSDGSTGSLVVSNGATDGSFSVTDAGNGWYRVAVSGIIGSSATAWGVVYLAESTSTFIVATADGSSGIFVWGAQLSQHSTLPVGNPYVKTEGSAVYAARLDHDPVTNTPKGLLIEEQRANLVDDSEDFTSSQFTPADATITADAVLAPDGTNTATELKENTDSSTHFLRWDDSLVSGKTYTVSVFMKKASGDRLPTLNFNTSNSVFAFSRASFNLDAGTVNNASCDSASIEDYGNGWFRCSATETATASGVGRMQLNLTDNGTGNYTGDGSSGIYIWGWQIEEGSFPTSYIQTTGSTATRNADVAVMGPTTGGTELVTNGTFDADSDWTLPSGGNVTIASGVLDYSSAAQYKRTTQSLASSLAVGRRYRASFEVTSFTSGLVAMRYFENGSLVTASANRGSVGTTTFDFTCTTLTGAEIDLRSQASGTNTYEVDNVSVRELYPFEQYNPAEGTVVCSGNYDQDDAARIWMFNQDNSSAPRIDLTINSSQIINPVVANSGGSAESSLNLGSYTLGSDLTAAIAFKEDNYAGSDNGDAAVTDTSGAMQAVDELSFGSFRGNSSFICGHISRFSYYPRRLPDETLESLSDD